MTGMLGAGGWSDGKLTYHTAIGNPRSPINLKISPMLAPCFYSSIY